MKRPKVLNQNQAANEGHTRVELAAAVRCRAYELYEKRGRADGHTLEDWVQAEDEILRRERTPRAA